MEKSFGEIITESFEVFKKSLPAMLKILGLWIVAIAFVLGVLALSVGTEFFKGINNPTYMQSYLDANLGNLFAIFAITGTFIMVFSYVFYCWGILIVRNNALENGKTFKETFFEAIVKFWRILVAMFILGTVCCLVAFLEFIIPFLIFSTEHIVLVFILFVPLFFATIVVMAPSYCTVFYGVICNEGPFFTVFWQSICLGFRKWVKIILYLGLITLICCFPLGILMGIIILLFQVLHLDMLGNIFSVFAQIIVAFLSASFFTVFYLDVAGLCPPKAPRENVLPYNIN